MTVSANCSFRKGAFLSSRNVIWADEVRGKDVRRKRNRKSLTALLIVRRAVRLFLVLAVIVLLMNMMDNECETLRLWDYALPYAVSSSGRSSSMTRLSIMKF